jgi:DUF4097 and DUF4098 domain-containing protein YvlB
MGQMNADKRTEAFQTPALVRLRVEIPKGRISVTAAETAETTIVLTAAHGDDRARELIAEAEVTQNGNDILVRVRREHRIMFGWGGDIEAEIRAPLGSAVHLNTGAGRIETVGRLGEAEAHTGAGSVRLDAASEVKARTGAGSITIAEVSGSADLRSGSGKIELGRVGADTKITTGAGDIEVGEAGDSVEAFTAAGAVKVRRADHGRVRAKTMAGRVSIGVAKGSAAYLDISTMSGRVHSELDASEAPADGDKRVELIIRTMSGDVNLARA